MTEKQKEKNIFKIFILFLGFFLCFSTASAQLIFVRENGEYNSDKITIDADDSAPAFVDLEFGVVLGARLRWDIVNQKFILNNNLDLSGNELVDVRLEQLSGAPSCDSGVSGRIYFNTTDGKTYSCNGTTWDDLTGADIPRGLTVTSGAQTLDYDTLAVRTLRVLSATSPNRPADAQFTVKTLGDATVKTQLATNAGDRFYRVYESGSWQSWQRIGNQKSIYFGYDIDSIDQTNGTASYIGRKRTIDSKWLITKSDSSGFSYAQLENNLGVTTFSAAWTDRLILNYSGTFVP